MDALFIIATLVVICACYGAFFSKRYTKYMWIHSKYLPFMPEKYEDFVVNFRVIIVVTLILLIALWIAIR